MRISHSRFSMYLRCGEQYRRRYVEKETIPPGIALIRGRSVHKGIELDNRHKLEAGKGISKKDLIAIADSEFTKTLKAEGVFFSREERGQRRKLIGVGRDNTVKLTGLYSEEMAPLITPKQVEMKFEMPCGEHTLTGRIDNVDIEDALRDTKTANKRKSQGEVDSMDQLTFYAIAYEYLFGAPPKKIVIDTLVCSKVAKYDPIVTARSRDDITMLIRRIYAVIGGMERGVYLPSDPTKWNCSPRWCGYYETCKYRSP